MVAEALPAWLTALTQRIDALQLYPEGAAANHVLINEYLPGQGIMPHEDGPLYFPTIATVSIGTHTVLNFYDKVDARAEPEAAGSREEEDDRPASGDVTSAKPRTEPRFCFLLEKNSLLILRGELYHKLHGIEEVTEDVVDSERMVNFPLCDSRPAAGQGMARGTRISFTIRHVLKSVKLKGALLFGAKPS
jgi:alkylated DNA repair protein alkB family protein 6